ncbi:hypothetical protein [Hydrogenophaga sp.]|uniref:hypothetical protein n=1 Tax=Hydrogenophaga sp. TaxID=1904254 RepID=UPI002720BB60|nr:hypothetical protein [Hydrogenophaga sp.]MDO9434197.1 hypothetical protein [Hydrogenophaga sp.]
MPTPTPTPPLEGPKPQALVALLAARGVHISAARAQELAQAATWLNAMLAHVRDVALPPRPGARPRP